jgi:hypothetical protein
MISPRNKFVNVSLSDFPGTRVTEKLAKENLDRKNALAGFFYKKPASAVLLPQFAFFFRFIPLAGKGILEAF